MVKQTIKRICHGCIDREAGQHVVNLNLESVEMVVDKLKSYQFNHNSIYTTSHHPRKEVRELSVSTCEESDSSDKDDNVSIRQTNFQCRQGRNRFKDPGRDRSTDSSQTKIDSLQKEVSDIKEGMKSLLRHMETLQSNPPRMISPSRSRSPSPVRCFRCQGNGHFAKDCPTRNEGNKAAKHVNFSSNLNEKGSGQQA